MVSDATHYPARTGRPGALVAGAQRLLEARRPDAVRALTRRERWVEGVAAASFVLAALALGFARPTESLNVSQALALAGTYAVLARVRFAVGSGFVMPTQLAFVPMVMLLPPALAPALVGLGLFASRGPDVLVRRARIGRHAPAERMLTGVADGWYAVAPAALLAFVAPGGALTGTTWPFWTAAFALQLGSDLVASSLRERLGSGVPVRIQAWVIGQVAVVDVLVSAVGLLAAFGSERRPYGFLLTLPLVAALGLFARERAARIARALALVDELAHERERAIAAQRRIGETAAANLDRDALERIIVSTAVELIGADAGRLSAGKPLSVCARSGLDTGLDDVLAAVESSLSGRAGVVEASANDTTAIGLTVDSDDVAVRVLAVARRDRAFSVRERELLGTLAEQAAVCLQNLALHEQVQRLAATDGLTGLLNHRRLQELLAAEIERAGRYDDPLALIMLDIDNFKQINDRHGHQRGDGVLRAVAAAVRSSVRDIDLPARYGGEEIAIVLPRIAVHDAVAAAERLRAAVAALRLPAGDGALIAVTASIGVAALELESPSRERLVAAADAALYCAKRAGKNRVELGGVLAAG